MTRPPRFVVTALAGFFLPAVLLILTYCVVRIPYSEAANTQYAVRITHHASRSNLQSPPHLGYGANVALWDIPLLQSIGFDWMKIFGPPGDRLPVNILLRVEANAGHLSDLDGFADEMAYLAATYGPNIEAYEIGNEVNLDASYGWGAPPIAADYAALLCIAYQEIKAADPASIVVSAGLAPTGRVQGNWNGHPGHNGLYQDERQYLLAFLAAGGGNCLDALGYHPYGFSADFDAEPDIPSADPTQNCANGFCFRGVEKIYEIMQAHNLGHKPIWATEFGWIVAPPGDCLDDPGWQGREWQIVSEAKQASNLVGAYQYADANWPWMGVMTFFNLDFNRPGLYDDCEQMRYYAILGRPAQPALAAMPKNPASLDAWLYTTPAELTLFLGVDEQPLTQTLSIQVGNSGFLAPLVYTVTADANAAVVPHIPSPTGQVEPLGQVTVQALISSTNRPVGVYTGTLTIRAAPGTPGSPTQIPITLRVLPEIHRLFLPHIGRD